MDECAGVAPILAVTRVLRLASHRLVWLPGTRSGLPSGSSVAGSLPRIGMFKTFPDASDDLLAEPVDGAVDPAWPVLPSLSNSLVAKSRNECPQESHEKQDGQGDHGGLVGRPLVVEARTRVRPDGATRAGSGGDER